MSHEEQQPPTRLSRRLGTGDAVVIGLGSMIGAGAFAALGPAADVAGAALLVGLAIAAIVAYCNATSSAELQPSTRRREEPTSTDESGSVASRGFSPDGASSLAKRRV